jgi:hypothetical protein
LLSASLSGIHYLTRPLNLINRKINIERTRRPSYPSLCFSMKYMHSVPWPSVLPNQKKEWDKHIQMRGIKPRPVLRVWSVNNSYFLGLCTMHHIRFNTLELNFLIPAAFRNPSSLLPELDLRSYLS